MMHLTILKKYIKNINGKLFINKKDLELLEVKIAMHQLLKLGQYDELKKILKN